MASEALFRTWGLNHSRGAILWVEARVQLPQHRQNLPEHLLQIRHGADGTHKGEVKRSPTLLSRLLHYGKARLRIDVPHQSRPCPTRRLDEQVPDGTTSGLSASKGSVIAPRHQPP